jgi:hypothetical protein
LVVEPVASHYTGCTIGAPTENSKGKKNFFPFPEINLG